MIMKKMRERRLVKTMEKSEDKNSQQTIFGCRVVESEEFAKECDEIMKNIPQDEDGNYLIEVANKSSVEYYWNSDEKKWRLYNEKT